MGIKEFFQTIQWGPTLQIAAIRIVIASILWPLLFIILGDTKAVEFFSLVLGFLLVLAAFIAIAIPAIGLARANVPFVGLAALPAWMVVIADPFVKLIHSNKPEWVPVDEFNFINPPVLAVFGTDDSQSHAENAEEEIVREHDADSKESGPDKADQLFRKALETTESGGDPTVTRDLMLQVIDLEPCHVAANAILAGTAYDSDDPEQGSKIAMGLTKNALIGIANDKLSHVDFAKKQFITLAKTASSRNDLRQSALALLAAFQLCGEHDKEEMVETLFITAEMEGLEESILPALDQYVQESPSNAHARLLLARVYINIARDNENGISEIPHEELLRFGESHLRQLLISNPDDAEANYHLFFINLMRNDLDEQQRILDLLKRLAPEKVTQIRKALGE